ncbi:hypothetical protein [Vibrio harveyi]|uniref:hypothetical protein n=1 Tax=Vibrio harveyi TaxID=669 RepID=UPI003CF9C34D
MAITVALLISACSDEPETAQATVAPKAPVPPVVEVAPPPVYEEIPYTVHDISAEYMSCYMNFRDAEHCEDFCTAKHGHAICDDIDDNFKALTKNPRHIRILFESGYAEKLARQDYLSCVFAGIDDDECEDQCAVQHGMSLCDSIENEYKYGRETNSHLRAAATGAAVAVILMDSDSGRSSSYKQANKTHIVAPAPVLPTNGKAVSVKNNNQIQKSVTNPVGLNSASATVGTKGTTIIAGPVTKKTNITDVSIKPATQTNNSVSNVAMGSTTQNGKVQLSKPLDVKKPKAISVTGTSGNQLKVGASTNTAQSAVVAPKVANKKLEDPKKPAMKVGTVKKVVKPKPKKPQVKPQVVSGNKNTKLKVGKIKKESKPKKPQKPKK